MRSLPCIAILVAAPFASSAAHADDKPLAEALFQDGRGLFEQGHVAEACAKLAASQQLEPKLGPLLNLATCHEREGKTASAWAELMEAEARAERVGDPDRTVWRVSRSLPPALLAKGQAGPQDIHALVGGSSVIWANEMSGEIMQCDY